MSKPKFNPNQSFEAVEETTFAAPEKPKFDPSKPFDEVKGPKGIIDAAMSVPGGIRAAIGSLQDDLSPTKAWNALEDQFREGSPTPPSGKDLVHKMGLLSDKPVIGGSGPIVTRMGVIPEGVANAIRNASPESVAGLLLEETTNPYNYLLAKAPQLLGKAAEGTASAIGKGVTSLGESFPASKKALSRIARAIPGVNTAKGLIRDKKVFAEALEEMKGLIGLSDDAAGAAVRSEIAPTSIRTKDVFSGASKLPVKAAEKALEDIPVTSIRRKDLFRTR